MNAPLPSRIDQIEVYRDILPKGFVEETIARQKLIARNREDARKSIEKIKSDCSAMASAFGKIEDSLKDSTSTFSALEKNSTKNANAFGEISKHMKEMSQCLTAQSQMIKKNLNV